jgi:hypothetical protein
MYLGCNVTLYLNADITVVIIWCGAGQEVN